MSTIEEFENAPVGATATAPNGNIAIKTGRSVFEWSVYDSRGRPRDNHSSDEMWRYTLNPVTPTSAREALDLAWELAHPVKEGQIIPAGTDYLVSRNGERPATMRANLDQFASKSDETNRRTLDPLPDPEPDWLDAPAVMARGKHWEVGLDLDVFTKSGDMWQLYGCDQLFRWQDLTDVTPLYPKEDA